MRFWGTNFRDLTEGKERGVNSCNVCQGSFLSFGIFLPRSLAHLTQIIERDLEHSLFCTSPENIDYARGATYDLALQ